MPIPLAMALRVSCAHPGCNFSTWRGASIQMLLHHANNFFPRTLIFKQVLGVPSEGRGPTGKGGSLSSSPAVVLRHNWHITGCLFQSPDVEMPLNHHLSEAECWIHGMHRGRRRKAGRSYVKGVSSGAAVLLNFWAPSAQLLHCGEGVLTSQPTLPEWASKTHLWTHVQTHMGTFIIFVLAIPQVRTSP